MNYLLRMAFGLTLLVCSCDQHRKEGAASTPRLVSEPLMMASPPPPGEEDATAEVAGSARQAPLVVVAPRRLLIYHADLNLRVTSLARASASLDSLVHQHGGYLSAANETRTNDEWRQTMTIRVLPQRFQAVLAALSGLGTVEGKKLTTDDVTAQHADVAARLNTKREVEKRYLALLAKARKITEILEIESKIGEVREEIESTEGRLKALNDEVSYSTIYMTCYQPIAQSVPEAPVVSFVSRLVEAFYSGWQFLTSLVIGLVAFWPLWLLGALGAWGWQQRRTRAPRARVTPTGE